MVKLVDSAHVIAPKTLHINYLFGYEESNLALPSDATKIRIEDGRVAATPYPSEWSCLNFDREANDRASRRPGTTGTDHKDAIKSANYLECLALEGNLSRI